MKIANICRLWVVGICNVSVFIYVLFMGNIYRLWEAGFLSTRSLPLSWLLSWPRLQLLNLLFSFHTITITITTTAISTTTTLISITMAQVKIVQFSLFILISYHRLTWVTWGRSVAEVLHWQMQISQTPSPGSQPKTQPNLSNLT